MRKSGRSCCEQDKGLHCGKHVRAVTRLILRRAVNVAGSALIVGWMGDAFLYSAPFLSNKNRGPRNNSVGPLTLLFFLYRSLQAADVATFWVL
jgi:hypothetical protein